MRFTVRWGVSSTCLAVPVASDSAGVGLGRAHAVSRRRVSFSFLVKMSIGTHIYILISVYVYKKKSGVASRSRSLRPRRPWFESRMASSFCFCSIFSFFCSSVKLCTMMIEMSSEQSKKSVHMHTECCCCRCCCCCCCSVCRYTVGVDAAAMLLLPAAVRHLVPDGQICCWFIEPHPSVFFLFIQTRSIFGGTPWQYCVVFTALVYLHRRQLRVYV